MMLAATRDRIGSMPITDRLENNTRDVGGVRVRREFGGRGFSGPMSVYPEPEKTAAYLS
jgi:hypothetical protein